jgi:hypothetical protein
VFSQIPPLSPKGEYSGLRPIPAVSCYGFTNGVNTTSDRSGPCSSIGPFIRYRSILRCVARIVVS